MMDDTALKVPHYFLGKGQGKGPFHFPAVSNEKPRDTGPDREGVVFILVTLPHGQPCEVVVG